MLSLCLCVTSECSKLVNIKRFLPDNTTDLFSIFIQKHIHKQQKQQNSCLVIFDMLEQGNAMSKCLVIFDMLEQGNAMSNVTYLSTNTGCIM